MDFSGKLGYKPQKDFEISRQLLMDIDATVCPEHYRFGKDGKRFYIAGPHETKHQMQHIVNTLSRNCGEGNFDYIVPVGNAEID